MTCFSCSMTPPPSYFRSWRWWLMCIAPHQINPQYLWRECNITPNLLPLEKWQRGEYDRACLSHFCVRSSTRGLKVGFSSLGLVGVGALVPHVLHQWHNILTILCIFTCFFLLLGINFSTTHLIHFFVTRHMPFIGGARSTTTTSWFEREGRASSSSQSIHNSTCIQLEAHTSIRLQFMVK